MPRGDSRLGRRQPKRSWLVERRNWDWDPDTRPTRLSDRAQAEGSPNPGGQPGPPVQPAPPVEPGRPEWLRQAPEARPTEWLRQAPESGQPEWLRQPAEPSPAGYPDRPDWLRQRPEPGQPEWLRQPAEPDQPSPARYQGQPEWLRRPAVQGQTEWLRRPTEPSQPEWLRQPPEQGQPEWLRQPAEPGQPERPRQPAEPSQPEWLRRPRQRGQPGYISQPAWVRPPARPGQPEWLRRPPELNPAGDPSQPGWPSQSVSAPPAASVPVPAPAAPVGPAPTPAVAPAAPALVPVRRDWRDAPRPRSGGLDPRARRMLLGVLLVAAYAAICLAPLLLVNFGHPSPRGRFLYQVSISLAYVGLAMLVLQFTLVSRARWLAEPFGIEVLHRFHKEVSFLALGFILAHPVLLLAQSVGEYAPVINPLTAPTEVRVGLGAGATLVLLVSLSVWRRGLRIPYDLWKATHSLLATGVVGLALWHLLGINTYTGGLGGRVVVLGCAAVVGTALVWNRLIAPRRQLRRPWRVMGVIPERGGAVTMVVRPEGHRGWTFMPGQFAWATVNSSPFRTARQHPFTISSPSGVEPGGPLAMTVKARGDWTRRLSSRLRPGDRIYLDGPHGSFSVDRCEAPGYVFIAAGVGITPIYSMVATLGQRSDPRPAVIFYANADWESITFREQLEELQAHMPNLRVVHVLKDPPPGWAGETGRIHAGVLYRNLPARYPSFAYFVCGGETAMDACEAALLEIGVPAYQIHTERFSTV
jgi:predicted ferric reductase